jgi:hypothetical protein
LPYEEEEPKIAVTKNSARLNGRLDGGEFGCSKQLIATNLGKETDRPNVSDFQHDSNEEDENAENEDKQVPSTSKK